MSAFKPICVHAQSLDNTSADLMYRILHEGSEPQLEEIQDLSEAQKIRSQMNDAIRAKNVLQKIQDSLAKIIKALKKHHLIRRLPSDIRIPRDNSVSIHRNGKDILIVLKTADTDNLGRLSPISILLDKNDIKRGKKDYLEHFHKSLLLFCQTTGRKTGNAKLAEILINEVSGKSNTLESFFRNNQLGENDEQNTTSKTEILTKICLVSVAIVVAILTLKNS